LETLFYLLIFFFYIVSSYREYQKKRKAKNKPITKPDVIEPSPEPELPKSETQSVLDFLNNAFEDMEKRSQAIEQSNISSSQVFFDKDVDLVSQDSSEHEVQPTFDQHFDVDHDMSGVDERHLEGLSTKIKHKKTKYDKPSYQISKIKSIQKKYSSNPFQLAIVMQEILNKPKSI
tara:strand:- start:1038 stop:1562 length:525 start_codon:yes stop_codon:yes gene_type:complete